MAKTVISPIGKTAQAGAARRIRHPAYRAAAAKHARAAAIAKHVIHLRTISGITQQALADRMGTSHTVISRLESGRHNVSQDTYDRAIRALGATPLYGYEVRSPGRPAHRELIAV
jgi:DNA-binding transcriptional regulator YiaG